MANETNPRRDQDEIGRSSEEDMVGKADEQFEEPDDLDEADSDAGAEEA